MRRSQRLFFSFAYMAFKLWLLVDAVQRRSEYYWYCVIFMPFGDLAYFFTYKIHDFAHLELWVRRRFAFFRGQSVKQQRYAYSQTPSVANGLGLGDALVVDEQWAEAADCYQRVLDSAPDEKRALHGLAQCRMRLQDFAAAERAFDRLLRIDRTYLRGQAWRDRVDLLWAAGKKEEAIADLRELLKKDSRSANVAQLSDFLLELGRTDEAKALAERVLLDYEHAPRHIRRSDRPAFQHAKRVLARAA